ncbi:MAG: tRNA (adenosine(37)-N6)-threonylcarbamoyltransferase complex dimerization subunit type 1 TsaB [Acidobacteriota bacterium]
MPAPPPIETSADAHEMPAKPGLERANPLLALDTGSPRVSLALRCPSGEILSEVLELRRSSENLLPVAGEMIARSGCHLSDLGGVVVLRGPGSFTGLRIGLATAMGLHQALGLRACGVETLPVLARAAHERAARDGDAVIAVVDALREEWMAQTFVFEGEEPQPVDEARLRPAAELAAQELPKIGFELDALAAHEPAGSGDRDLLWPAPPLAPLLLEAIRGSAEPSWISWDPGTLVEPIYFRPPAVTPPRPRS